MNRQPLRVLVVHNRYRSEQPSGEDRVVAQEAALLADAGHRVDMFQRFSDDIKGMSLPQKVAVPLRIPWNTAVRTELVAFLRGTRPDVVHIHNTFPLLSPSVVSACTEAGIPAVATLHNYMQVCPNGTLYRDGHVCMDCAAGSPIPGIRHGCYRGSGLATVPLAFSMVSNRRRWRSGISRFFCTSRAQRDILVATGMPAETMLVKHNFVPEPGVRRTGHGEHVLYLGRLTAAKGLPVLMKAWDMLAARGGVGLPLVLAGTGPLQDEVARWARGRADTRYLGLQSTDQCHELTARAASLVVPSSWLEVFGLVAVEAMAAGVPVVAAGHGGLSELVEDGVTGLLHRPGDASSLARCIERVVADTAANRVMGTAARHRYEHGFSPAVGLERLVAGYRAAIRVATEQAARPAEVTAFAPWPR